MNLSNPATRSSIRLIIYLLEAQWPSEGNQGESDESGVRARSDTPRFHGFRTRLRNGLEAPENRRRPRPGRVPSHHFIPPRPPPAITTLKLGPRMTRSELQRTGRCSGRRPDSIGMTIAAATR